MPKQKWKKAVLDSTGWRAANNYDNPDMPWHPLNGPSTETELLEMLLEAYWHGVRRELGSMVRTLSEWETHFPDTVLADETDDFIHGFDTFIDQISLSTRRFADGFAKKRWKGNDDAAYTLMIQDMLENQGAYETTASVKKAVRETLKARPKLNLWERRAKMILQTAGWLDIDKLVEYREPPDTSKELGLKVWNKPRVPQLILDTFDQHSLPRFKPLHCKMCEVTIRGVLFKSAVKHQTDTFTLEVGDFMCEGCFRGLAGIQNDLVKQYKHCVMDDIISLPVANALCRCTNVRRRDRDGNPASPYPVDIDAEHRRLPRSVQGKCGLFLLGRCLAEEKHNQLQMNMVSRTKLMERKNQDPPQSIQTPVSRPLLKIDANVEDDIDGGVPLPVRRFLERYPMGNSHLSIMVGPLVIENGAGLRYPQNGALISCREPLHLQTPNDDEPDRFPRIALSEEKIIFTQNAARPIQRRLKACMKQVVSGAFSGLSQRAREMEIIRLLLSEAASFSKLKKENKMKSESWFEGRLEKMIEKLFRKVRALIAPAILSILQPMAAKLFDPNFKLKWDFFSNNCQRFCDGLLSYEEYGKLFTSRSDSPYLVSFVCRPESYTKFRARSKYDVPNGLTEEYLLKFRYGRHDDSDIVDTLQEYWHDWGNFHGHLYEYQDIFPWDCTEAYGRYHTTCNECNIAKHVWSFPFDSWSIIQLHLQKDRRWYPPITSDKKRLTDSEWMENRLRLCLAQDVLIEGAVAIREHMKNSCDWLTDPENPQFDRLKLGGIHRPQPFSHHYERGHFSESYVASWIHLRREDRISQYELLRHRRIMMRDMAHPKTDESFDWEHFLELGWLTTPLMFISIGSTSELPPPPDTDASALDVNLVPNNFDQPGYVPQLDRTIPDAGGADLDVGGNVDHNFSDGGGGGFDVGY